MALCLAMITVFALMPFEARAANVGSSTTTGESYSEPFITASYTLSGKSYTIGIDEDVYKSGEYVKAEFAVYHQGVKRGALTMSQLIRTDGKTYSQTASLDYTVSGKKHTITIYGTYTSIKNSISASFKIKTPDGKYVPVGISFGMATSTSVKPVVKPALNHTIE